MFIFATGKVALKGDVYDGGMSPPPAILIGYVDFIN